MSETIVENLVPKAGAVSAFWETFCRAAGVPPHTPYQAWYFGDSPTMAHELVELVLNGPKRATASSGWMNETVPEAAPVPDGYSVVTEHDGTPRAVIRTVWLEVRPLADVDPQFAWDEGEGDRTLRDWMDAHERWFKRECERHGRAFFATLPVALERFELLYPFDRALAVPDGPRIVPGYLPGAIGAIAILHASYYGPQYGLGAFFEAKVASELGEFVARFDPARDGMWLIVDQGRVAGSIGVDGSGDDSVNASRARGVAQVRWFILDDALRGRGLGRRLVDAAMAYCRHLDLQLVYLDTLAGLDAARALYERAGFRLVREIDAQTWGRTMREQRFEWTAPPRESRS